MKKKAFIYTLIASSFLLSALTSCDTNDIATSTIETTSKPIDTTTNTVLDNLLNKAYNEFKNSFENISYDNFKLEVETSKDENEIKLSYMSSYITVNIDGSFIDKEICIHDENDNILSKTYSKYVNEKWVILKESKSIQNNEVVLYSIALDQNGSFTFRYDYTYNEEGHRLTKTESHFVSNEWVKTREMIYINNEEEIIYSIAFNADNSFSSKTEYTYDENGKILSETQSFFKDNEFVYTYKDEYEYNGLDNEIRSRYEYINNNWVLLSKKKNSKYDLFHIYLNNDGSFESKHEYTYDDDNNLLTHAISKYLNNEWVKTNEFAYFGDMGLTTYNLVYDNDGTFISKTEYTYPDNATTVTSLTKTVSKYVNNTWVVTYKAKYIDSREMMTYQVSILDNTLNSKEECTYDDDGNLITHIFTKYDNGEWEYSKKTEYTYDIRGKELQVIQKRLNNTEWVISNKTLYIYDENYALNSKEDYTYDSEGNHSTVVFSRYINKEWVEIAKYVWYGNELRSTYILRPNDSKTLYTYDEKGNQLTNILSLYLNGEWKYFSKTEYIYDINGNVLQSILKSFEFDWVNNSKTDYFYDENNNCISQFSSSYKNNEWIYDTKVESEYDENNNKLYFIKSDFINGEWENKYRCDYSYNASGNLSNETISHYVNGNWVYSSSIRYTYDDNGEIKSKIELDYINNTWEYSKRVEYVYDGNTKIEISSTYEDGVWAYSKKSVSTYTDIGICITSIIYTYVNGEWVLKN